MVRMVLVGVLSSLLLCCTGTKPGVPGSYSNASLDGLVASKRFEIVSNWASPMLSRGVMAISNSGLLAPGSTAGRIDLTGNTNFLKIQEDSVSAYLPYYGERQMGGGYNRNSGIEFKGIPTEYEVSKNTKGNGYMLRFTIAENSENYQVFVNLFPDMSTTISVNSSQRDAISYYGNAKALTE